MDCDHENGATSQSRLIGLFDAALRINLATGFSKYLNDIYAIEIVRVRDSKSLNSTLTLS